MNPSSKRQKEPRNEMRLWGNSGHVESTFGCNLRVTLGTFLAPIYLKLIKRANFKVKLAFKDWTLAVVQNIISHLVYFSVRSLFNLAKKFPYPPTYYYEIDNDLSLQLNWQIISTSVGRHESEKFDQF